MRIKLMMAHVIFTPSGKPDQLTVTIDGRFSHTTPTACLEAEIAICHEQHDTYEVRKA